MLVLPLSIWLFRFVLLFVVVLFSFVIIGQELRWMVGEGWLAAFKRLSGM